MINIRENKELIKKNIVHAGDGKLLKKYSIHEKKYVDVPLYKVIKKIFKAKIEMIHECEKEFLNSEVTHKKIKYVYDLTNKKNKKINERYKFLDSLYVIIDIYDIKPDGSMKKLIEYSKINSYLKINFDESYQEDFKKEYSKIAIDFFGKNIIWYMNYEMYFDPDPFNGGHFGVINNKEDSRYFIKMNIEKTNLEYKIFLNDKQYAEMKKNNYWIEIQPNLEEIFAPYLS